MPYAGIRAREAKTSAPRVLKVHLPVSLLLQLHARRLSRGISASETVRAALERYLTARGRLRTLEAP